MMGHPKFPDTATIWVLPPRVMWVWGSVTRASAYQRPVLALLRLDATFNRIHPGACLPPPLTSTASSPWASPRAAPQISEIFPATHRAGLSSGSQQQSPKQHHDSRRLFFFLFLVTRSLTSPAHAIVMWRPRNKRHSVWIETPVRHSDLSVRHTSKTCLT